MANREHHMPFAERIFDGPLAAAHRRQPMISSWRHESSMGGGAAERVVTARRPSCSGECDKKECQQEIQTQARFLQFPMMASMIRAKREPRINTNEHEYWTWSGRRIGAGL